MTGIVRTVSPAAEENTETPLRVLPAAAPRRLQR